MFVAGWFDLIAADAVVFRGSAIQFAVQSRRLQIFLLSHHWLLFPFGQHIFDNRKKHYLPGWFADRFYTIAHMHHGYIAWLYYEGKGLILPVQRQVLPYADPKRHIPALYQ